jgi:hypothetical protein
MNVNPAPQCLHLRLDVTRIFFGVFSVPEGQPMLARDFSPWDPFPPARVPSGRLKRRAGPSGFPCWGGVRRWDRSARRAPGRPRAGGDPPARSFRRPDGTQTFFKAFQGLKSLANIGRPSGTKATQRRQMGVLARCFSAGLLSTAPPGQRQPMIKMFVGEAQTRKPAALSL